jgi:hypothetical protein
MSKFPVKLSRMIELLRGIIITLGILVVKQWYYTESFKFAFTPLLACSQRKQMRYFYCHVAHVVAVEKS